MQKRTLGRSGWLRLAVAGLITVAAASILPLMPSTHAAQKETVRTKMLIVYYSWSGNTGIIANMIHGIVGGDMIELKTVHPYPTDYNAATKVAKEELNSGFKPALKTKIESVGSYDIVFVGSPNWWGTFAGPVKTFLSDYDLSGKTLIPFITHEGSGLGHSVEDIKKLCPKSTVREGLAVRGKSVKGAQKDVSAWLSKLGLGK